MSEKKKRKNTNISNKSSEKKPDKKLGKALSTALVIAIAAATVFLGGIGDNDTEAEKLQELQNTPPAIEYVVELPDDIAFDEEDEKKQKRHRSKAWALLSMPLSLIGSLLGLLLKPLLGKALGLLLILTLMFGIFCLILKILNPDKSLKELLTKKNILMFFCFAAVFAAVYYVPDIIRPNSDVNPWIVLGTGCITMLAVILLCTSEESQLKKS